MYSTNFDEKYVIDGKMGEGAFGCVMRCKQKATGKQWRSQDLSLGGGRSNFFSYPDSTVTQRRKPYF